MPWLLIVKTNKGTHRKSKQKYIRNKRKTHINKRTNKQTNKQSKKQK